MTDIKSNGYKSHHRDNGVHSGSSDPQAYKMWFRDCERETTIPIEGVRTGIIPSWINGRLTRNGPGLYTYGDTSYKHLFDGSACLHQFTIKQGRVTYQSRLLQSDDHLRNAEKNRIVVTQVGTVAHPDPCKTLYERFMSFFEVSPTDNCSVNVVHMGDELYAMTETPTIRKIDPATLQCIGEKTRVDRYVAVNTMTAHPHVDPDGTVYNMGSSFASASGPVYNIVQFPPPSKNKGKTGSQVEQVKIVASIPSQWKMHPSYYHSFGMTDNYFVFVEMPLVASLGKMIYHHLTGKSYIGAIQWYPEEKTNFCIVDRKTGKVLETRYVTDAFLTFHHTNVYEEDGHLVVDLTVTTDGEIILRALSDTNLREVKNTLPRHRRYVLPLNVHNAAKDINLVRIPDCKCKAIKRSSGIIEVEGYDICDRSFELQRINYKYNGKKYRYSYGIGINEFNNEHDKLIKMDAKSGKSLAWSCENKFVSEPIFVASPNASGEDDGVILSSLLDKTNLRRVSLLVLDAQTWKEMGRVDFKANGTVTPTFHGHFAASGDGVHRY